MNRNNLLRSLGLLVRDNFLSTEICSDLSQRLREAPSEAAQVYVGDGTVSAVDQRVRRSLSVELDREASTSVERALDTAREELASHFQLPLVAREPPHYLVYGPGAFFKPHRDRAAAGGDANGRLVSMVVFLNAPGGADAGGYHGGELNFFGLIDEPPWMDIGFGCDAAPGRLIAFRAETLHEVTPVTHGQRLTIVTWFS